MRIITLFAPPDLFIALLKHCVASSVRPSSARADFREQGRVFPRHFLGHEQVEACLAQPLEVEQALSLVEFAGLLHRAHLRIALIVAQRLLEVVEAHQHVGLVEQRLVVAGIDGDGILAARHRVVAAVLCQLHGGDEVPVEGGVGRLVDESVEDFLALGILAPHVVDACLQLTVVGVCGLVRLQQPFLCQVGLLVVGEEGGGIEQEVGAVGVGHLFQALLQVQVGGLVVVLHDHDLGLQVIVVEVGLVVNLLHEFERLLGVVVVEECHPGLEEQWGGGPAIELEGIFGSSQTLGGVALGLVVFGYRGQLLGVKKHVVVMLQRVLIPL